MYDTFYMPSTEEVIARLGQVQFLSKLDLAKEFYQVPMADNSPDLTTLSCKFGEYRYAFWPQKYTKYFPSHDATLPASP